MRIPVSGPWITDKEIAYVTDAVTNAWYERANMYHERFEAAFAAYLGVKHAVALPSCTSAIHLALLAAGVGEGDEVIVPDLTWIASAAPITYVGATPVFADVDPLRWTLDPASFEAAITPRTKAVIPVDLYGNMADMDAIIAIAKRHGIVVIEDAAEAVGSRIGDRLAGSLGDMGVFSFHGSKTLTTGEGGMWVGNDDAWHARVLFLRDHGRKPGDKLFWNSEVAYKYKMSSMQAALGLAQLERVEELVTRKREIFAWYREALPGFTLNHEAPGTTSSYWMVTALLDSPKDEVQQRLAAAGIDARPFFYPLSSLPAYAHLGRAANPHAYAIAPSGINLPSGFNMTPELVARVAEVLK
ncbi:MAG: perosamine synthetase [Cyanobacteria bacterium RYN_339]|nr:perosamine synthetase [Cyanobacteria bacterium RYN_339]